MILLHLAFCHFQASLALEIFALAQSVITIVWCYWIQTPLWQIDLMFGSSYSNHSMLCYSWFDSQVCSRELWLLTLVSLHLIGETPGLDRPCFSFCVWISHLASHRSQLNSWELEWRSCCFSSACRCTFRLLTSVVASFAIKSTCSVACVWTSGCAHYMELMRHLGDS